MHLLLLLAVLGLCTSTNVLAQKDNGNNCDCFRTTGATAAYFTNHQFLDYRNVPQQYVSQPPVTVDIADDRDGPSSSDFFTSSAWSQDWEVQTWNNADSLNDSASDATTLMGYSRNNVYIGMICHQSSCLHSLTFLETNKEANTATATYLTLRTTKTETFQSAGEIDSVATNYQYLSATYYARVVGAPGACAGMFTWYCPGLCRSPSATEVEEADVEILTKDPNNYVHFTNQPSESPEGFTYKEATRNASVPISWDEWNEYRYDWVPGLSAWYINGQSVANISFHAPERPAQLILNIWSNGGSWTGNMSVGNAAYLQIQWIEIGYNTSNEKSQKRYAASEQISRSAVGVERSLDNRAKPAQCKRVCQIDSLISPGTPLLNAGTIKDRSKHIITMLSLVIALLR
jgi:hypothetical protein